MYSPASVYSLELASLASAWPAQNQSSSGWEENRNPENCRLDLGHLFQTGDFRTAKDEQQIKPDDHKAEDTTDGAASRCSPLLFWQLFGR